MYDITLIGGGIMSATLSRLLKELNPNFKILILESQDKLGLESSGAWNNAGTGHAGLCELNYTPEEDGTINIDKALDITEFYEISKQFWSYFVKKENIDPSEFIHRVPHVSLVSGSKIPFLKSRFDKMKSHHFYKEMEYCDNAKKLADWIPLIMENQKANVAATRVESGTDVNFGKLTELLIHSSILSGVKLFYKCFVKDIEKSNGNWKIKYKNRGLNKSILSKYVFIGAGGASLLLLEKTNIPESKEYGGFPISGQWLVCKNKEVINKHHVKVYGIAPSGAPVMSMPHLDTRIIEGKKELLFGPFAGFSTKFLRNGSVFDLIKSVKIYNIWAMLKAGYNNIPLTKYLLKEVNASFNEKMTELRAFFPDAKDEDWELQTAGQRVQIINKDKDKGGIIEFGTKVVSSKDGTMSALLGASPGASTSVHIMVTLIEDCFPEMKTIEWIEKMQVMIPSYGKSLIKDESLYKCIKNNNNSVLKIAI
jgi:malate dehydrogenase (quinone)